MRDYHVVLADDHVLLREGIKNLIDAAEGLKVVGEAGDGMELLRILERTRPDLVILDITMPRLRGTEAAHEIRSRFPDMHILFLTMHKSQEFLSMALSIGARGYLLKEDSGKELLQAIDAIRKGRTYLSSKLALEYSTDIIGICRGNPDSAADPLTQRERQVLKLIADGNTDRQISELLCISLRTAQRHRYNIRTKLNLKRTAELVKYAIARGYTTSAS